ncbi:MAG: disulfide bond formation protein DsbA [Rhizobacter sp.]|nr:disulfide bond formation protein DsbA [Rhizobacter sp.]
MKRRHFSAQLCGAGLGLATLGTGLGVISTQAFGQRANPVEGTNYVKLARPVPSSVPAGKAVEVIEFMWYGCPHCYAFEPTLDAWQKKLPADVAFRRVPVAFREEPFVAHQRIYYALEALGQVDQMHRKVFFAIHNDRQRLDKPNDIAAFMAKNGIDSAKFLDAYNSFSVSTKCKQAAQLASAYQIDGVPALGVGGKYWTSGGLAGGAEQSLAVTEYLANLVRKGG